MEDQKPGMQQKVVFHSSAREFKEFAKTRLWADIKRELGAWIDDIHAQMEDPDITDQGDKLYHRLVGNVEAVRKFFLLPQVVAELIDADNEQTKQGDDYDGSSNKSE